MEGIKMTEKQVFTKDNLSALLRLQADALDRGEVLEFEEGRLHVISVENTDDWLGISLNGRGWVKSITLKPKPQLRKATAMEWLEWACSSDAFGWAVSQNSNVRVPNYFDYLTFDPTQLKNFKRAKFENGKLGEFDYFWKEV
jgi:hypothetical protein